SSARDVVLDIFIALFALPFIFVLAVSVRTLRGRSSTPNPSEMRLTSTNLELDRTGIKRDLDVSWEVAEIVDFRMSATHRMSGFKMVLLTLTYLFMMKRDYLVRVSVELPTGEIEDVTFETQIGPWVADVE